MPLIDVTFQFPRDSYTSLQIGDIGFYTQMTGVLASGFQINQTFGSDPLVFMGPVKAIDNTTSLANGTLTTSITFEMDDEIEQPTSEEYIFFSKNDRVRSQNGDLQSNTLFGAANVNAASPLGYYSSIKFSNASSDKAELYAVNCEVSESSK